MHSFRGLRYNHWLVQARDALGVIDQLGSHAQPTADVLCLRGQCCSALGNNALVSGTAASAHILESLFMSTLLHGFAERLLNSISFVSCFLAKWLSCC